MSIKPATVMNGPSTTNSLVLKRYVLIYIVMIWLDSLWPIYSIWTYAANYGTTRFFLILPFHAIGWYFMWVVGAIIIAKIFLIIVNLIHKPREGYFPRDRKNKDYRYWCIRSVIKKYPFYILHNFPLPWVDILAFKLFGVKASMKSSLFDAWVDTEFLEIGKNTIIGQGSLVMSSMITKDYLIIKKIKIGDNCVIGGYSVVSPGSIVGDNVTLGTHSATTVDQELESNWVYLGVPARKYKVNEYKSMEQSDEEMKRTSKEFIKQYLTIDEVEEIETSKLATKKQELRILKEKEAELLTLLEGETDEVQIRRTERALAQLRQRIQQAEERKTMREMLGIRITDLDKLTKRAEKLKEKINSEKNEEDKKKKEKELKELEERIEVQKRRLEKDKERSTENISTTPETENNENIESEKIQGEKDEKE